MNAYQFGNAAFGDVLVVGRAHINEIINALASASVNSVRYCADVPDFTEIGMRYDCVMFDLFEKLTLNDLSAVRSMHNRAKYIQRPGGFITSYNVDAVRKQRNHLRERTGEAYAY
jgi:hypothetical protein